MYKSNYETKEWYIPVGIKLKILIVVNVLE